VDTFQTVEPTRIAARAIQLERRLGLVGQVKVPSEVLRLRFRRD